jgi:predicted transcriptional regulator
MTTKNKTQYVTVRLPDDIMAKLKAEAERNTRSLSAQVLHYIRLELDKVKP